MSILVTGAAGFIGFHVAKALLSRGERVIGVDNLNEYYDVRLKQARLDRLHQAPGFRFHRLDIADAVYEAQDYTWQALAHAFRPGMGQHLPDRLFWARESADEHDK